MKIELDAAVHEFMLRMLASILFGPQACVKSDDENERVQELAFMRVLEAMVASGDADHKYDKVRGVDEFKSTDRLIRNWSWVFPGDKFSLNRSRSYSLTISGKRSRYFNSQWAVIDPNGPPPQWPS
jgi:hypothetical protein